MINTIKPPDMGSIEQSIYIFQSIASRELRLQSMGLTERPTTEHIIQKIFSTL